MDIMPNTIHEGAKANIAISYNSDDVSIDAGLTVQGNIQLVQETAGIILSHFVWYTLLTYLLNVHY